METTTTNNTTMVENTTAVATQEEPKKALKKKVALKKKSSKAEAQKNPKTKAVKEAAKQQKPSIIEEVVAHREVKYIYPADVTDTLSRKSWRTKVRNKLHKLEMDMRRISDQNSKEYKKAEKAYKDYMKEVLKPMQTA